jgi:hypothetical protein
MTVELEQQLRAALAPCSSGPAVRAAVLARVSAAAATAPQRATRRLNRTFIAGALVCAAAAAAVLLQNLSARWREPVVAAPLAHLAAPAASPGHTAPDASAVDERASATPSTSSNPQVPRAQAAALSTFTVLVQPLRLETDDPALQTALREFYASAQEELRAIRGLILLGEEQSGAIPASDVDYRLAYTGRAGPVRFVHEFPTDPAGQRMTVESTSLEPDPAGIWRVELKAESVKSASVHGHAGAVPQVLSRSATGRLDGGCSAAAAVADRSAPCSPAGIAATQVEQLRIALFPADPDLSRRLQTRLHDRAQPFAVRLAALTSLHALASRTGEAAGEGEAVRGALDLLAGAANAAERAEVWRVLRERRDPALLRALINMVTVEQQLSTRMEVLATLIAGYKEEPAVQAALRTVAAEDPDRLARQVAARALSGDEGWNHYVANTLQDSSLPPAERFAPLAYLLRTGQSQYAGKLLDDKAISALVAVVPPLLDDPERQLHVLNLIGELYAVESLAVIDLAIAGLDKTSRSTSRAVLLNLLHRHREEPRARATLERIAATDPDASIREAARLMMSSPTSSP